MSSPTVYHKYPVVEKRIVRTPMVFVSKCVVSMPNDQEIINVNNV